MVILVTGANGFVGSEIALELEGLQFEVYKTSGFKNSANKQNLKEKNFFAADITDYKNLAAIENLRNVDAVIHSAGLAHQFSDIEREKFQAVNVNGTENILKLALKLNSRQFILISSTAVYGIKKERKNSKKNEKSELSELEIDENAICLPDTPYGESKLEAEKIAIEFCEKNKIALTVFRLAPVIGEGNMGNAARLVEAIDRGKFIWIGKGNNWKSLIYKNDVARACVKVLSDKKEATEIFNLATEPLQMLDFVSLIEKKLKRGVPKFSVPANLFEILFKFRDKMPEIKKIDKLLKTIEKWLSDDIYSAEKIGKAYNFRAKTTIAQAIEKQIDWYQKQKSETNKSEPNRKQSIRR